MRSRTRRSQISCGASSTSRAKAMTPGIFSNSLTLSPMKYMPLMRHNISPPAQFFQRENLFSSFCSLMDRRTYSNDFAHISLETTVPLFLVMLFNVVPPSSFLLYRTRKKKLRPPSTTTTATATNRKRELAQFPASTSHEKMRLVTLWHDVYVLLQCPNNKEGDRKRKN